MVLKMNTNSNSANIVTALGTGGYIPNGVRETSCVLLKLGGTAILFDAGTGCRRLSETRVVELLRDVSTLHVVLSHLHHDHIAGLTWLLRLWTRSLVIYVPTEPILSCNGVASLRSITTRPYFGLPLDEWPSKPVVKAIDGAVLDVDGIEVSVLHQRHDGGSAGYRVGSFAYITDTEPDERHVQFLRDCPVVFMDTMYDAAHRQSLLTEDTNVLDHGSSVSNGRIASDAHVGRLGLVHLDPGYDETSVDRLRQEVQAVFADVFIPVEGQSYSL